MKFYITREQSNIWQYSHNGQPRLDERASQMAGHGALARCLQPPSYACHFADKRVYRLPRNAVASSPALTPSSLLLQA